MTKEETLDLYLKTFPTEENPLTYSELYSYDQIVDFVSLALEAGEPLEFEEIEKDGFLLCDAINCKLKGEILIPK